MAYYLTKRSQLHSEFSSNDILEMHLIRNDKTVKVERISKVFKLEGYKKSLVQSAIIAKVRELDELIEMYVSDITLLRSASYRFNESLEEIKDAEKKDKDQMACKIGLFSTFLLKIPDMITFDEVESVEFFSSRFLKIFEGVGSILTGIRMRERELLRNEVQAITAEETNVEEKLMSELIERNKMFNIIGLPRKCVCNSLTFKNPFSDVGNLVNIKTKNVVQCDGIYSVYHTFEKYLKTIVQFGCSGDDNEGRLYIYFHLKDSEERKNQITNITILLEPRLSATLRKYAFGMTAITLFKTQKEIAKELIPLVHSFPHLEFHLLTGLRVSLLDIIKNHEDICSFSGSAILGKFLAEWMIENKIYKGVGDSIEYLMQPYFTSLVRKNIMHDGKYDLGRLRKFPCPEVLRMSNDLFKTAYGCILGLRQRYQEGVPTLSIEFEDYILTGCGAKIQPVKIFSHPCFVYNMMIGKNMRVEFDVVDQEHIDKYHLQPYLRSGSTREAIHGRTFCRLCKREYGMIQFSLLCAMRCMLLEECFINGVRDNERISTPVDHQTFLKSIEDKLRISDNSNNSDLVLNNINLLTGVLVSEIPYYRRSGVRKSKNERTQILSLSGDFKNVV